MANAKISKRSVDAAPIPAGNDAFLWDTELRGFGLRVTPKGVKSYVVQYRLKGRPARRMTIGLHGSPWTPDKARERAQLLLMQVRQGVDPVEQQRRELHQFKTLAFEDYVERFTDLYLKKEWKDTWPSAKRRLELHVVPYLKGKALPKIERNEIALIFDRLQEQPATARNTFAVLRKLFRWAVNRGDIEVSPVADMDPPSGPQARKRVFLPDELMSLYLSTYYLSDVFGSWARLLMFTLQRRNEVSGMRWEELDQRERLWTIPAERTKNGKEHVVPLNYLAFAELDQLGWKRRGLLFTTTGKTPISGFSKAKNDLDREMKAALQDYRDQRADSLGEARHKVVVPQWGFHDIRRTGTTQLQALGVPIEVTEKVINHISGTTAGVAGVYNLWAYFDEKRGALERWGEYLLSLVEQDQSKVVALAERRRA